MFEHKNKLYSCLDIHVTAHCDEFLIIKPTRCTNFSILFLEGNSACFEQFLCPTSGVFHSTHSNGISHAGLLNSLWAGSGWNCVAANLYDLYRCCVDSERLLMMDRGTVRNMQSFPPKIKLRN